MGKSTKTHNGASKDYRVSKEREKMLLANTDKCTMVVALQEEITKSCASDVMAAEIETAKKIKDGVRPEKQGDSINPQYAFEIDEGGPIMVTDRSKGRAEEAQKVPENETQRASREKLELSQRAEEKYNDEQRSGEDR